MAGKLGKLRGRSPKELAERLRQGAAMMPNAFALVVLMLLILGKLWQLIPPSFLSWLARTSSPTLSLNMKEYILTRAKRICEDKFDLLGFEGLDFVSRYRLAF